MPLPWSAAPAALLLALTRGVRCAPLSPAPPGAPAPPPAPPGAPAPAPAASTCNGSEPAWTVSPWWPPGAVFRCGCGLASAGNSWEWNDVTICGALGDLLYATGSPQLTPVKPSGEEYSFSWKGWPNSGWHEASTNVSADYCSTFTEGVTVTCGPSATGVQCTKGCGMMLDGRNLTGTLPASFSALAGLPDFALLTFGGGDDLQVNVTLLAPFAPNLQYLNIRDAPIMGGTLPPLLGSFTALTSLNLGLSNLVGTLPPELGSLSSLVNLDFSSNALEGGIPGEWAGMTSLMQLTLYSNALSGTLPLAALCGMSALASLDVSYNSFSGSIPSGLGSCLNMALSYMNLNSNVLTGSIPDDLADVLDCVGQSSMVHQATTAYLGLAGNRLTGDLPQSLTNKTCIFPLQLQRAVSVCPAGTAETASVVGTNELWQKATCAACAAGTFSSSPGALACTACDAGYYSFLNGTGCAPCDAGSFLNVTAVKSGVCQACWPGSYSARGATTCVPCQANTYAAPGGTACTSCPDGSTSSLGSPQLDACVCAPGSVPHYEPGVSSSFTCRACAAGTFHDYSDGSAAGTCSQCPPNTYNAAVGSTTCTPVDTGNVVILNGTAQAACPAGSFLNITECAMCQPGTFSATRGATVCPPCPPATIAASAAATACDACPASSSDSGAHTVCTCADGYYDAALGVNGSAPQCTPCADGGECVGGALLAQEGWWRESPTDALFLKCREGYCLAENPSAQSDGAASPSARRRSLAQQLGSPAPAPAPVSYGGHCAEGHSGPLCAVCQEGYTMQGSFCQPCGEGDAWREWSRASRGVTIAFFALAGALLLTLLLLLPLLPAWEHVLWRCTGVLGNAAAGVAAALGALRRRCCGGGDPEVELAPRSSAARASTARWSALAFGRISASTKALPRSSEQVDPTLASTDVPDIGSANADDIGGDDALDSPVAADGAVALLEAAAELLTALMRPAKILINFYQIASTFIDSLDVPWPSTFTSIMSRVNVVNVNFLQLPKTACLYPNTPFYDTFQGYTLGTTAALALVGAAWVAGQRVLAPRTLRLETGAERAHRLRRFQTVCLSRVLLLLYLVYPGVSGVVIAVFNCRTLPSGRAVLVADHRETCWTAQHWRYVAAGIFWVLAVPLGIPAAFLGLLYYFRVPHLARAKVADAWLREAAEHTWRLGVPQPPCNVQTLSWHSVSDEHLELLVAALVHGEAPDEAQEAAVAAAKRALVAEEEAHSAAAAARRGGRLRRLRRAVACGGGGGGGADGMPRPGARRAALQKALLRWCETSATLSLPPLAWAEPEDEAPASDREHREQAEAAPAAASFDARRLRTVFSGFSTAALTSVPPEAAAALEQRALRKIGFLFAAYTVQCWPWEIVELARKLLLTSLLALVAPGSATQVTVGVLVAFATLLLFQRLRPYAAPGMNFVASVAQVNLFMVLFVGLLLKVRVNGDATDSKLFNALVALLSVVPIALPVALKASSFAGALNDDDLEDAMDEAGKNAGAEDED